MVKYYCDCCGKERNSFSLTRFEYLRHIATDIKIHPANVTTDLEGDLFSNIKNSKDLCNKCYNKIMSRAWQTFLETQAKAFGLDSEEEQIPDPASMLLGPEGESIIKEGESKWN